MEFTINTETLKNELALAQGCLEKKNTIPALNNILIQTVADGIRITTTDLNVTYRSVIEAEIKKQGAVCIEARKLIEIIGRSNAETVKIKADKNEWAKIESGKSNYRIAGIEPHRFPQIETAEQGGIEVKASDMAETLRAVMGCTTAEQSRFIMSCVKFTVAGEMKAVACNGHVLGIYALPYEEEIAADLDCLIPKEGVKEFINLLRDADGNAQLDTDENHIILISGRRTIIARKSVGDFPNYHAMLMDYNSTVNLNAAQVVEAIRRVAICADERTRSVWLNFDKNTVEFTAISAEEGEAAEKMEIAFDGEPISFGFQARYLIDVLSVLGEQDFTVHYQRGKNQVEFHAPNFRYVVSTLRF